MDQPLPPHLRRLATLVTILTAVMILGICVVIALIALVFLREPQVSLPDTITLAPGETAIAVTQGRDWTGVVVESAEGTALHLLDPDTGTRLQTIPITPEP